MAEAHHDDSTGIDLGRVVRRVGLFVAVAVIAVIALATLPGISEVRARLGNADPVWVVVCALCSLGSSLGFVAALWGAFDRVPPGRAAVLLGFAEQGANVLLPAGGAGGPALGTIVMRKVGVPPELAAERHTALFLATSGVGFFAIVVAGIVAALTGETSPLGGLLPAAGGATLFILAIVYARLPPAPEPDGGKLRHLLWRLRRFLHNGVRITVELVRHGDRLLIVGALTYYVCDVASLWCMFAAFGGGGPPVAVFFLAYTLGHAGALLPTPGGVGGTEGGLIGMFVAYGAPLDLAAAAVLAYRVFQLGLPAVAGAVSLLRIRHVLAHPPSRELIQRAFENAQRARGVR
jgi:uncharacterized membrane protein YbhN (UPF0104 family)